MIALLAGAVAMGSLLIALFFLRFWRTTGDRFFLYFALSFLIEGLHRIYAAVDLSAAEDSPHHFLVRLLAYVLILWAILEKNWPRKKTRPPGVQD